MREASTRKSGLCPLSGGATGRYVLLLLLTIISGVSCANTIPLSLALSNSETQKGSHPSLNPLEMTRLAGIGEHLPLTNEANRFAAPIWLQRPIQITIDSDWQFVGNSAIWQHQISTNDAKSLNLKFDQVQLPPSGKIFLYDPDYQTILGPYRAKDINSHGELWTAIVQASSLIVEINVAKTELGALSLELNQVNYGYKNWQSTNASCHTDIACEAAADWRQIASAVARYTVRGQLICSGTLLNQAANADPQRPLFLTAKHCRISRASAESTVFYWQYQASSCEGDRDGDLSQSQTGASLRAASADSDFALLELAEFPVNELGLYYSGWNARSALSEQLVTIHHPFGEEKSISFDFDPPQITDLGSDHPTTAGAFFRTSGWETGTTSPGSSGAGLWNPAQQLIGTLAAGEASCESPTAPDWFGRFATHWQHAPSKHKQTKYWLTAPNAEVLESYGQPSCQAATAVIDATPSQPGLNQPVSFTIVEPQEAATYSWDFNDDGVIDAQGRLVEHHFKHFFQGLIRVYINGAVDCPGMATKTFNVSSTDIEQFPFAGLLSPLWQQTRGSAKGWQLDSSQKFEGQQSLKSMRVSHGETAGIELVHHFNGLENNYVSFAVKVSSESADYLRFYVDNHLVDSWSGNQGWKVYYYPIEPGTHILRWTYEKDAQTSEGSDAAWVDGVTGITRAAAASTGGGGWTPLGLALLGLLGLGVLGQRLKAKTTMS